MKFTIACLAVLFVCAEVTYGKKNCDVIACTLEYMPICGSDGKTYGNECALRVAKCEDPSLRKDYDGECCPPRFCNRMYDPVCGSDGQTYASSCVFRTQHCNDGVEIVSPGECP